MSLIGDSINISSTPLPIFNLTNVPVGPGAEASFTFFNGSIIEIDVDDDSFLVSYTSSDGANFGSFTYTLSDLDWVGDPDGFITGVTASDGSGIVPTFTNNGAGGVSPSTINVVIPSTSFPGGAGSTETFSFDITTECFLTGTHLLSDRGEIPVEELNIGDVVKTADGKLETIKWIGRQTVDPNRVKNVLRSHPILVKAGALGNNLPHRDLYVSPDHSLFIDGLLINAGALVNDISIVKTEPVDYFTYYHVELENHCLLVAEGTAAESYLPQKENRDEYDNFAEYEELYPNGSNLMLWPMDYPRISSWNKVPRFVSKKLLKIAHQLFGQDIKLRA